MTQNINEYIEELEEQMERSDPTNRRMGVYDVVSEFLDETLYENEALADDLCQEEVYSQFEEEASQVRFDEDVDSGYLGLFSDFRSIAPRMLDFDNPLRSKSFRDQKRDYGLSDTQQEEFDDKGRLRQFRAFSHNSIRGVLGAPHRLEDPVEFIRDLSEYKSQIDEFVGNPESTEIESVLDVRNDIVSNHLMTEKNLIGKKGI